MDKKIKQSYIQVALISFLVGAAVVILLDRTGLNPLYSDAAFVWNPPVSTAVVSSPAAGSAYRTGDIVQIRWSGFTSSTMTVSIGTTNGSLACFVRAHTESSTPNDGVLDFQIPANLAPACYTLPLKAFVVGIPNQMQNKASSGTFTITR